MTEDTQRAEKQVAKESSSASVYEQGRESLAHEAIAEAIKGSQAAGAGAAAAGRDVASGAASAAAGAMKDSLPNVVVHDGNEKSAIHNKIGASDLANHKMDKNRHNDLLNKTDEVARLMKDGKLNPEDFMIKLSDLLQPKDGVQHLSTGDYLVREDGRQTLFTPNGDRISINPDGTHTIKGDVKKVSTDTDGVTTVNFGDGATVSFDNEGFRDIQRGCESVSFGRSGRVHVPEPFPFPFPEPRPLPEPYPFPHPHPLPEPYPFPHPHPFPEPEPRPFPFPDLKPNLRILDDLKVKQSD